MRQNSFYFFSRREVAKAVSMSEVIEAMKDAFVQLSLGQTNVPQRMSLDMPESDGTALFMPVYSSQSESLGVKIVSIFHQNPSQNLPTIQAMVFIMDAKNGKPLAMMDGEQLTALRTGAASGLATDLLARKDSEIVAIFGAGAQGRTQLEGVCDVRNIKKSFIFDKDIDTAKVFSKEMSEKLAIQIEVSENPENLKNVDIICTATNSQTPVFADEFIKEGVHINAIGAYTPQMSEVPITTVARSKIVIDQKSACLAEAGDLVKAIEAKAITADDFHAELGEIVAGKKEERTDNSEITLFKSVGNAIQDLITANLVVENSIEKSLGTKLSLS